MVSEYLMVSIFSQGCAQVVPTHPVRDLKVHALRRDEPRALCELMVESVDLEGHDVHDPYVQALLKGESHDWGLLSEWRPMFKRAGDEGAVVCLDSLVFKIAGILNMVDKWTDSVDDMVFERVMRGRLQDPEVRAWLDRNALPSVPRAD
jgi:hypothetical protein